MKERDEFGRSQKCRDRLAAKAKADPVIALAKHIGEQLKTPNERRGFWSRLKREMAQLYYETGAKDKELMDQQSRELNPRLSPKKNTGGA